MSVALAAARTLRAEEYAGLCSLLFESAGIVLEPDKQYLAETRLESLRARLSIPSIAHLVEEVLKPTASPDLRRQVIEAMLNGETLFFRDLAMFDMLRTQLIPRLMAAREAERRIVIWSAACSTGQEPYSLAMFLDEHFPMLRGWDVEILATDLSEAHLKRARAGVYSQFEINRGLPASLLVQCFQQTDGGWSINPVLKERIKFSQLNLVVDWPPAQTVDIALVRNVMIYWDLETRSAVIRRLRRVLAADGALILGGSESMLQLDEAFENVPVGRASYYRKSTSESPYHTSRDTNVVKGKFHV